MNLLSPATRHGLTLVSTTSLSRQLADGAYWSVLGAMASRGSALLTSLMVARWLGRISYGKLGVIETSVGMFAVFANLGLSLTSTKFVSRYRESDPARAGRIICICCAFATVAGLVMSGVLLVAAPWLAANSLNASDMVSSLRLAAAVILLAAVNGSLNGALVGLQAFRAVAKANVISGIASLLIMTVAAGIGGLNGAVVGLVFVQLGTAAIYSRQVQRTAAACNIPLSFQGCWHDRHVLTSFSLPALLNSAMRSPVNWLCAAMLVNQSNGYAQMGLLNAVNPWFLLLMFLPGQLANVYYPMLEESLASGHFGQLRNILKHAMAVNVVSSTLVALIAALFANHVMNWYGPEYAGGAGVLRITAVTGVIIAAQQPLSACLIATCNMWLVASCSLVWAIVCIATSYVLIDSGAEGIAWGRLVSYAAYAAVVAMLSSIAIRKLPTHDVDGNQGTMIVSTPLTSAA